MYPDLPLPLANGTGAQVGRVVYAGLGSARGRWLALDLDASGRGWVERASFPGVPRDQARAVVVGGQIFVLGGVGVAEQGAPATMLDDVHRYDPVTDVWSRMPTRIPLGLLGSALWSPDGRQILAAGGVNKAILDGFFADIAAAGEDTTEKARITEAYFDRRPQDFFFTADVLGYSPDSNRWTNFGRLPFPPVVGAAVTTEQTGEIVMVNGEIKPGLRSRKTRIGTFDGAAMHWSDTSDLPGPDVATPQEGLAGAYVGHAGGVLLLAGGTNFPGSWAAFDGGKLWAQRGLTKTWLDCVYALVNGTWRVIGRLPRPLANGLSYDVDGGILLVGGDLQSGEPVADVLLLGFNGVTATFG